MAQCGLPLELPPTVLTQVKHLKHLLELYHLEYTHETKSKTKLKDRYAGRTCVIDPVCLPQWAGGPPWVYMKASNPW